MKELLSSYIVRGIWKNSEHLSLDGGGGALGIFSKSQKYLESMKKYGEIWRNYSPHIQAVELGKISSSYR